MLAVEIFNNEKKMLIASREGIDKATYENLRKITGFNKITMAKLSHISSRTLERTKNNEKIRPEASERAILIAKAAQIGKETFGSQQKFNAWLNKNHSLFSNEKPIDYLSTLTGINKIIDELYRIQHGIF